MTPCQRAGRAGRDTGVSNDPKAMQTDFDRRTLSRAPERAGEGSIYLRAWSAAAPVGHREEIGATRRLDEGRGEQYEECCVSQANAQRSAGFHFYRFHVGIRLRFDLQGSAECCGGNSLPPFSVMPALTE